MESISYDWVDMMAVLLAAMNVSGENALDIQVCS